MIREQKNKRLREFKTLSTSFQTEPQWFNVKIAFLYGAFSFHWDPCFWHQCLSLAIYLS